MQKELKRTFKNEIRRPKTKIDLTVTGAVGKAMTIEANGVRVNSSMALQTAFRRPLTEKLLREQLGRMGETDYELGELHNKLVGPGDFAGERTESAAARLGGEDCGGIGSRNHPAAGIDVGASWSCWRIFPNGALLQTKQLVVLCRTMEQLAAVLESGCETVYVDFEDIRRYTDAVASVRERKGVADIFGHSAHSKSRRAGIF